MDIREIYYIAVVFIHDHTIIVSSLVVALGVFIYYKPKAMFKIMILAIGIGLAFYIISLLGESMFDGVQKKEEMIHKTKKMID